MKNGLIPLLAMALLLAGCAGEGPGEVAGVPPESQSAAVAALPEQSQVPETQTQASNSPGTGEASPPDITVAAPTEAAGASGAGGAPAHETSVPAPTGDVVEISERLFIAQTNDIYINTEDYLGKTIKYEGIFKTMYWQQEDKTIAYVIRYGPGCCGYDGEAGFEVVWDGAWPEEDDWCEVVGVLEEYEVDGYLYLRLELSSLTVLQQRGAEFVSS